MINRAPGENNEGRDKAGGKKKGAGYKEGKQDEKKNAGNRFAAFSDIE